MWAEKSVFYQIYSLGLCDSFHHNDWSGNNHPEQNSKGEDLKQDGVKNIERFIPHLKRMNINAVYFTPIFESDYHGYDTRDFRLVDRRIGSNEAFAELCDKLHKEEIRVVLDGVFHHVGRGFWAFQDVIKNRENSAYRDWFFIDLNGNSNYNDGLWYEGWEGHYDLVKLNLRNPNVTEYLFESIAQWIEQFHIDGIRLDVAYCLDVSFLRQLRDFCDSKKEDFFLLGEMIHGDYNRLLREAGLNSVTNYECYKGLYSSFNDMNLFEINHSLTRQFGNQGALYSGTHLFSFVDNHDVSRIASILKNKEHLPLVYTLLLTMPGIPCIYYGSEWGITGEKKDGDTALRPYIEETIWNDLTEQIGKLVSIRIQSQALNFGEFTTLHLTNRQCVIERRFGSDRILIGINADGAPYQGHFQPGCSRIRDLLSGQESDVSTELRMGPYEYFIWEVI